MGKEETSVASVDTEDEVEHVRNEVWEGTVMPALRDAVAIAWDECHKIYVLKDNDRLRAMRENGYPQIVKRATKLSAEDADAALLETLKDWFSCSCTLKFIEAVTTVTDGDPNDGYESLIEQFHPAFIDTFED